MSFHRFLQDVRCELQEILWWDVPRGPVGGEVDRLEKELHRALETLRRLRAIVDELRTRLAQNERRAQRLKARVEVYLHVADQANAWRSALELDHLQRTLDHERARLERRKHAYQAQRVRVQDLQERLDELSSATYPSR